MEVLKVSFTSCHFCHLFFYRTPPFLFPISFFSQGWVTETAGITGKIFSDIFSDKWMEKQNACHFCHLFFYRTPSFLFHISFFSQGWVTETSKRFFRLIFRQWMENKTLATTVIFFSTGHHHFYFLFHFFLKVGSQKWLDYRIDFFRLYFRQTDGKTKRLSFLSFPGESRSCDFYGKRFLQSFLQTGTYLYFWKKNRIKRRIIYKHLYS